MLVEHLVDRFRTYFEQSPEHDTILWFDPQRDWEGLLHYLKPHLALIIFQGGQLALRYRLVNRSPGEQMVVYLPLDKSEAVYLRPFFYTSKLFESSIETVLYDYGITLPETPGVIRSLRPLLPALAVASVGKGEAFWKQIVNLDTALARLIPDFEDLLLQLLASPARTMADLEARQVAVPFLDLFKSQFGAPLPEPGEGEAWADRFTGILCLVDLYLATGKPADFPFKSALPKPVHWDRCQTFLGKWLRDEMYKDSFARRAKAIDAQYSLADWVRDVSHPPVSSALLNVEKALWEEACKQLDEISDKTQAIAYCRARQTSFKQRAQGFWSRQGSLAGWSTLAQMAEVIIGAADIQTGIAKHETISHLIQSYTEAWWQVDQAYRHFRAGLDQGLGHLDAALKWSQRIYQDYLEALNQRFVDLLTQSGRWPPSSGLLGLSDYWNTLSHEQGARKALLLIDGLRYELGQELAGRLPPGSQVTAGFGLGPLPSVTPLGMAALLPGWSNFKVDYRAGKWVVQAPGEDINLAEKANRLAWLKNSLGNVHCYDLEQWLQTPLRDIPSAHAWIVISSTEIDAIGEGAGAVAWHTFDALLGRLEQAIRRLLAAGCDEIILGSDHGFLLREDIQETDKVEVKSVDGILKKAERYLVGASLPPTDLPAMPVSNSDHLVAWFPRGIGCFMTPGPYNYMHGGISLHELLTARLAIKQSVMEKPVGVNLELVSGSEIRNAIFKIRLLPTSLEMWTRGREINIEIVRTDNQERVSEVWEEQIHHQIVEKSLRLSPDSGLAFGDKISVRVRDAVTEELLSEVKATCYVDLVL
ncbi:MAG: PglZ domain-containing protein [Anaerolineales bacterium]|nr:PglZ domain-containing protein [Anaerolineales bacterium]